VPDVDELLCLAAPHIPCNLRCSVDRYSSQTHNGTAGTCAWDQTPTSHADISTFPLRNIGPSRLRHCSRTRLSNNLNVSLFTQRLRTNLRLRQLIVFVRFPRSSRYYFRRKAQRQNSNNLQSTVAFNLAIQDSISSEVMHTGPNPHLVMPTTAHHKL
jgi:hypothetical protein